MDSSASLDNVLRRVLSAGNKEMNMHYPPHIYEEHYNISTDFIIDECVRLFPENSSIVDVIRPFLGVKFDALKNDKISLPDNYRNFLGAAINVKDCGAAPCDCVEKIFKNDPLAKTPEEFKEAVAELGCEAVDVDMLDKSEFNNRTTHSYKKPTLAKPIGTMISKEIKICPKGVSHAEVFYVRRPKRYRYGYIIRPDDTYIFDPASSEESEWDDAAFQYLFKAISSLYSIYTRDGEMQGWTQELKKIGLF